MNIMNDMFLNRLNDIRRRRCISIKKEMCVGIFVRRTFTLIENNGRNKLLTII